MCVRGQGKASRRAWEGGALLFRKQRRRAGRRGACWAATQLARRAAAHPAMFTHSLGAPSFQRLEKYQPIFSFSARWFHHTLRVISLMMVIECGLLLVIVLYFTVLSKELHCHVANSTMLCL